MCGGTESQWPCKTSLGPLNEDTDMVRGRKVAGFNENVLRTLLATLTHALALCVHIMSICAYLLCTSKFCQKWGVRHIIAYQRFVWTHQISKATLYKG